MKTFYAKPDQSYEAHLEACYTCWQQTIAAKEKLIERASMNFSFSKNRFIAGSLLTIALHDIGKMTESFQEMMEYAKRGKRFQSTDNYRHELASLPITAYAGVMLQKQENLSPVPLEALAVVGHHKILDTDLTSFENERISEKKPRFIVEGFEQSVKLAQELFDRENFKMPIIPAQLIDEDPYSLLAKLLSPFDGVVTQQLKKENRNRARVIYYLLKGILHYADWHASGRSSVRYWVQEKPESIIGMLKKRCREKGIAFEGLRPFQKKIAETPGNIIAIAPTGSGKTEASVLWALSNARSMGEAKILYFLPTKVTANSIWKRMCEFFGEENVGLTHSSAELLLSGEFEDESDKWENRRNVLFDRSFIRPITVSTVDQLLTAGFNSGKWTLKEANASNAVIVLDEIHAYDPWTLGLIVSSVRHFQNMGARFLFMSATMPRRLIDLLKGELNHVSVIRERTLLSSIRSQYEVRDCQIEEDIGAIINAVESERRVLVVVNTVKRCQEITYLLKDMDPVCYHSRFILKDRKSIEAKLDEASLVVATQTVEVSLDIDFDWLFTECAPPDAVAQRAGRINRYRNSNRDSKVIIYRFSEKAETIYNPIADPLLLEKSFNEFKNSPSDLTEQDLIQLIDTVYKDYNIEDSEEYIEAVKAYEDSQRKRLAVLDSRLNDSKQEVTRKTKYESISVIPDCFFNDVVQMEPKERKWYELQVPFWYLLNNKREYSGLLFCDLQYDSFIGGILKPRDLEAEIL